jgi:PIN domain nuclease of toxin-antitoxin system
VSSPVLDAHALLVYFEREEGFETVKMRLSEALTRGDRLPMTVVNLGEVLYIVRREEGHDKAEEIERAVQMLPIEMVDVDMELTREAVRFKSAGGISFADSYAAALASLRGCPVLTGDPEFAAVAGQVLIDWLRTPQKG